MVRLKCYCKRKFGGAKLEYDNFAGADCTCEIREGTKVKKRFKVNLVEVDIVG